MTSNLKHQISIISPTLESLRLKKQERVKEISELEFQIAVISAEIAGTDEILDRNGIQVDEVDLTTKKLGEMKSHLHELQYEKVWLNFVIIIFLNLLNSGSSFS